MFVKDEGLTGDADTMVIEPEGDILCVIPDWEGIDKSDRLASEWRPPLIVASLLLYKRAPKDTISDQIASTQR